MASEANHPARTGALLVPEPERSVLAVSGADRVSWLNGVVTCDVAAVTPERAAFGLLLNKQGKIQTDFYLCASGSRLLLALAPGTETAARAELERMLVMEDAELTLEPELAAVTLHGPRAVELARVALDRTGLGGAVLVTPRAGVAELEANLTARGAAAAQHDDWLTLRIERGVGLFGTDYGPADNPHEATLDRRAIAWSKGCYLGQEVVFMQDARGKVKRRLALLALAEAKQPPAPGERVHAASGEEVGEVTSAAMSSVLGGAVALARLKAPSFEPETPLMVGGVSAIVRREPL